MSDYRVFEVTNDDWQTLKGKITFRLDAEDKDIFAKLKKLGMKLNMRKNKLIWWDDDYVEIINKKTERTVGIMELSYGGIR